MSVGDERQGEWLQPVRVEREPHEGAFVVRVSGQVDSSTAPDFGEQLAVAFAEAVGGRVPIVVDLTEVDFLASVGLSLLVQYHLLGNRQGTPLRVVAPARNPLRALRATMLDQTLQLYRTVPEAVAAPSS